MAAAAGWYPDPGGQTGLYRYWDGKAWSAATSPHPTGAPPAQPLVGGAAQTPGQSAGGFNAASGGAGYGSGAGYGGAQGAYGGGSAYAQYQQTQKKKSPIGWWIAGAALVAVIVIVAVIAIRAVTGGTSVLGGTPGGQGSQDACPPERSESPVATQAPADGRVHGGPLSYPTLGSPFEAPRAEIRVPFGVDVQSQEFTVQTNYQPGNNWVASVLVGELQAGDGFFTPEQGSQIVVKCILGRFYGNNPVTSDVKKNAAATIDGHEAWIVESQLNFDIRGLDAKGELLIVAIVSAGERSGIYYASIPDTTPELVAPARKALADLEVDS